MNVLSIIPVKDLNHTKTRLEPILGLDERQALTLRILARTIGILKSSERVRTILVSSPDPGVLALVKGWGALGLRENGAGLNQALQEATRWSLLHGFDALLIIPSDIPFLQQEDIEAILSMGSEEGKVVVLSPDNERCGTNALFVKPPGILTYSFGSDSFTRHQGEALHQRVPVRVYSSLSIGFDLDSPEQYDSCRGRIWQ